MPVRGTPKENSKAENKSLKEKLHRNITLKIGMKKIIENKGRYRDAIERNNRKAMFMKENKT